MNRKTDEYIKKLRERIEYLETENVILKNEMSNTIKSEYKNFITAARLTPTHVKLFICLLSGDIITHNRMYMILYDDAINIRNIETCKVFIYQLRKRLKPFNIVINTHWGIGYYMTNKNIQKVNTFIQQS